MGKIHLYTALFQIVLTIILAYIGFSYWALIIPLIISPMVQYVLLRRQVNLPVRIYSWKFTKRTIIKIKSLMSNLSMNNLVKYWAGSADKLVIGKLYTQAELGLYNRAFRFIQLTNRLITGLFGAVLLPSLQNLLEERGDVNKEYHDLLKILILLVLPVSFILAVFPVQLVTILWGNDWIGVAAFLPYIGIIIIYNSVISTMSSVFLLYRKEKNLFLMNLINSTLTILLVVTGGLFSLMHIIKFLTLGYILLSVPIHVFYGFYRSFHFKPAVLAWFWIPMVLFGIALFISVEAELGSLKLAAFAGLFLFLLYELRMTLQGGLKFLNESRNKRTLKNEEIDTEENYPSPPPV